MLTGTWWRPGECDRRKATKKKTLKIKDRHLKKKKLNVNE